LKQRASKRPDRIENPNLRMTRQRLVILEELRKVKTHPSADELYEKVKRRLPHISLGTVYRNLEILSRLGEIQHVEIGGTMKRFDGNPANHYHIRCTRCGRVDDVEIGPLKQVENALAGATDYRVTGHRLEFVGLCRKCLK
jgi:Fe2+ or Zn2+ uptake regulation protein